MKSLLLGVSVTHRSSSCSCSCCEEIKLTASPSLSVQFVGVKSCRKEERLPAQGLVEETPRRGTPPPLAAAGCGALVPEIQSQTGPESPWPQQCAARPHPLPGSRSDVTSHADLSPLLALSPPGM
uniref:Uncharacterized protein n=1 Tax=Myotis myotis TaxID=51298 RepID=A0A7J7XI52_MYOMY|nr:hypothetical protein mMyoMyo1_011580 [Myotis myotis]